MIVFFFINLSVKVESLGKYYKYLLLFFDLLFIILFVFLVLINVENIGLILVLNFLNIY